MAFHEGIQLQFSFLPSFEAAVISCSLSYSLFTNPRLIPPVRSALCHLSSCGSCSFKYSTVLDQNLRLYRPIIMLAAYSFISPGLGLLYNALKSHRDVKRGGFSKDRSCPKKTLLVKASSYARFEFTCCLRN